MKIITHKGTLDTKDNLIVLIFNDDNELNEFITKLANSHVRTSGARVLTLVPETREFNPIQTAIISIIDNLDGIGSARKEVNDNIIDGTIDSIKNLIDKHS